jgi:hypothetical protein
VYCVWISARGSRVPVIWPAGFRARLDPLEVLNAAGAVFARAGQKVGMGGGSGQPGREDTCLLGKAAAFYVNDENPVPAPAGMP